MGADVRASLCGLIPPSVLPLPYGGGLTVAPNAFPLPTAQAIEEWLQAPHLTADMTDADSHAADTEDMSFYSVSDDESSAHGLARRGNSDTGTVIGAALSPKATSAVAGATEGRK